jgi:hypothetical protein
LSAKNEKELTFARASLTKNHDSAELSSDDCTSSSVDACYGTYAAPTDCCSGASSFAGGSFSGGTPDDISTDSTGIDDDDADDDSLYTITNGVREVRAIVDIQWAVNGADNECPASINVLSN